MAYERTKDKSSAFWPLLIGLLAILGVVVFYTQYIEQDEALTSPQPVQTPASEWTSAPEYGVDVDLPETPLRRVEPVENEADADTAATVLEN